MKRLPTAIFLLILSLSTQAQNTSEQIKYPIVATGQTCFYNNTMQIEQPKIGESFYGQDAEYTKNKASYTDNHDGTITDEITGLMWQKGYTVTSYPVIVQILENFQWAGYSDWRLPTIKELYSLVDFNGIDASSKEMYTVSASAHPFIDTSYFDFKYSSNGSRVIDVQLLSSTRYQGRTMKNQESIFGLNIADGRIKAYPITDPRNNTDKLFTVRLVRGNRNYGENVFTEANGTVSDLATRLMWSKEDSKVGMNWEESLKFVQQKNKENYLGYSDWRLPNAKELHSIVDYSRSPQQTKSAAIHPIFSISTMTDESGNLNYPSFWTSTTHLSSSKNNNATSAVYICFGEAMGYFSPAPSSENKKAIDVHGAGAQRCDPKNGNPSHYPQGHGPQGDVIRINNYVRLVRNNTK